MAEFEALLERRTEERDRAQLNAGIIAAAIYNANPFRKEGSKAIEPVDFVPNYKAKLPVQTIDEQIAIISKIMGTGPGLPS